MKDADEIGYSKEEYFQLSSKNGLSNRCPILGSCHRAFETMYEMDIGFSGSDMSFEKYLQSIGEQRSPDAMIKSAERVSWHSNGAVTAVRNMCPEIMLFESQYLPIGFRQSAFGNASYYEDTHRFQAEPKHFRECAEFSEFAFQQRGHRKIVAGEHSTSQIPEKWLEDYLENNLDRLEPGLKFLERQKQIGKWKVDIFASDSAGVDVLIELKSKVLNRDEADRLCGQVSRYYHHLKPKTRDLRVFIVIPRNNGAVIDNLYYGLKAWIDGNNVAVFEFDYSLYEKKFTFSKLDFSKIDFLDVGERVPNYST